MDANIFPTFEERIAYLAHAMNLINAIAQTDLDREIVGRALALYPRVCSCAVPHETNINEEMAIHIEVMNIQDEVHKVSNYRTFIRRLEEADTGNLLGCYMPERSWVQNWPHEPYFADGCKLCQIWSTDRDQTTDCKFLASPLEKVFKSCVNERWGLCEWARRLMVGTAEFPQPRAPIDNYIVRVAEYSRMHSPPNNIWTFERIINTLLETYDRVNGFQLNYRQFIRAGWQSTIRRIDTDADTAAARVRAFLTPVQVNELEEAIFYNARMYYVASCDVTEDWRYINQQPRRWVLDELRANPPSSCQQDFYWGRILTISRIWPLFETDKDSHVWVWCQYLETGRMSWDKRLVGSLDGRDPELDALVIQNRWDRQAWDEAMGWWERLVRQRGHEDEDDGMDLGRSDYGFDVASDDGFYHDFGFHLDYALYEADEKASSYDEENLWPRDCESGTELEEANGGHNDDGVKAEDSEFLCGFSSQLALAEMHSHDLDIERMSPRKIEDPYLTSEDEQ